MKLYKRMLLAWMREQISQNATMAWLQDSGHPAYRIWVYYTGGPGVVQSFADVLTALERAQFRQAVKADVGQMTFAQLMEEERNEQKGEAK